MQDAEFVAVWVGQNVPLPACFGNRLASEQPCAQRDGTLHFGGQVFGAQIQVQPVLPALGLGHLLQQDLYPLAVGGNQALVRATGRAVAGIAEQAGPELGGAVQVAAVNHDDQVTAPVGLRVTAHLLILPATATAGLPNGPGQSHPVMPPTELEVADNLSAEATATPVSAGSPGGRGAGAPHLQDLAAGRRAPEPDDNGHVERHDGQQNEGNHAG